MSLKSVPLKKAYSSDSDDILHDFYIPALSEAIEYDRIAGFFPLAAWLIGSNGGKGLFNERD
jgi:hypothetical protein